MILEGKVVIVTGAGPGMGRALCLGAAREGAKVVVSARSVDAIHALRDEIVAAGGEAIAVPCDVSETDQCRNLAAQTLAQWGRIDGLVNSAYYHPPWTPLHEADLDKVTRVMNVNALGSLRMAQAVIPAMIGQTSGSIVNVSTIATRKCNPGEGGYAMAKAAVNQMSRQLAGELTGTGIRVNTALMGWMDGASLDAFFASMGDAGGRLRKQRASEIPVGHIPRDADCAKAIYFLLSDYASEVTGASLDVNGGDWMAP
ncbi:putative oxidoreductase [Caenibius tardaugens NBRC 16725]|uniref:Putative oxidoreductase n=1 Tax=Caenibius tardaugens NBRC 16725 TaxID=1219035 RepID=U3A475_9SPHN|nr:SDR family oxidoreductase [Caenibius tardaugens]AZI36874.1 SDR family oxidoreductase [Caenibius tardaugens NBRC 16725]GAD49558.1 putative oxidoreductase [Caenibius tardaugens NBRC 16725]